MRIARSNSLMALMIVFLTLLSFGPAYSAAAENRSTPSKKELKVLLKTAKTPSEHRTIAAYYRQEAQRLMEKLQTALEAKHVEARPRAGGKSNEARCAARRAGAKGRSGWSS
jgi:hypothetical protein